MGKWIQRASMPAPRHDLQAIAVGNCGKAARLVRNEGGNRGNWLRVKVVGSRSNRDGVGTQVQVVAGDLIQRSQVRSRSSYFSSSDKRLHFGLGAHERVEKVVVKWHSGIVQQVEEVHANQLLIIEEHVQ